MITFTAVDGSTVTPKTRADLMKHPAFAALNVDSSGNPCVWRNSYSCQSCTSEQIDWTDDWSCQPDDECPECGSDRSPEHSEWIAHGGGDTGCPIYDLWESLPEVGLSIGREVTHVWVDEAETLEKLSVANQYRTIATILAALRFWQREGMSLNLPEWNIATDGLKIEALTSDEIDRLCEQING